MSRAASAGSDNGRVLTQPEEGLTLVKAGPCEGRIVFRSNTLSHKS